MSHPCHSHVGCCPEVIRWAAPFDFAPGPGPPGPGQLALPALEDQFRSEELRRSLEAMMKDAGADPGIPWNTLNLGDTPQVKI